MTDVFDDVVRCSRCGEPATAFWKTSVEQPTKYGCERCHIHWTATAEMPKPKPPPPFLADDVMFSCEMVIPCPKCGRPGFRTSEHLDFDRVTLGSCGDCGVVYSNVDSDPPPKPAPQPTILVGGPLHHCRTDGTGNLNGLRVTWPYGQGTYHRTAFWDKDERRIYVHEDMISKEECQGSAYWTRRRVDEIIAMANAAPATVGRFLKDEDPATLEKLLSEMMAETNKFYANQLSSEEREPEPKQETKIETWHDREPLL